MTEKGDFIETILVSSPFVRNDPREEKDSFVGSCLLSVFRHEQSTQKEHIHNHKVVAERVVELQREGSYRAQDST